MEHEICKETRVWQRVQQDKQTALSQSRSDHLPALIMEQLQLSAAYLQLARQFSGKEGAEFVRLAREAKAQAVCMKGILTLMTDQSPEIVGIPPQFSAVDITLRRCYGKELQLLKECENRRTDAEYGPVFERMAQRGREHCCMLLELIGKTGKKRG